MSPLTSRAGPGPRLTATALEDAGPVTHIGGVDRTQQPKARGAGSGAYGQTRCMTQSPKRAARVSWVVGAPAMTQPRSSYM